MTAKAGFLLRVATDPQRPQILTLTNEQEINLGPVQSKQSHGKWLKTLELNSHSEGYKKETSLVPKGTARKIAFLDPDAQVKKKKDPSRMYNKTAFL